MQYLKKSTLLLNSTFETFGFEPTDKTVSEGLVRTYHNFHKYPCSSSPFEETGCHLAVGLLLLLPEKIT